MLQHCLKLKQKRAGGQCFTPRRSCTSGWRGSSLIALPMLSENVWRLACGVRTGLQSTALGCGIASPLATSNFKFHLDHLADPYAHCFSSSFQQLLTVLSFYNLLSIKLKKKNLETFVCSAVNALLWIFVENPYSASIWSADQIITRTILSLYIYISQK